MLEPKYKNILTFYHPSPNKPADSKLEKPLIIFIHHYGGSAKTSKRHVLLVNELGYDALTFSFSGHGERNWSLTSHKGLMESWSYEIENVVSQYGSRDKVLFSFSGPSASAFLCINRRFKNHLFDIKGIICDSGPFTRPWSCTRTMLKQVIGIKNPLIRELRLSLMMLLWGLNHTTKLKKNLREIANLNPLFPILSFRGIQDEIVPPQVIEEAFAETDLKNIISCELPSEHLTLLKEHPEIYRQRLATFLKGLHG